MRGSILVTGGQGQLATALREARPEQVRVVGRPEFDFDRPESIVQALAGEPALVVNTAAWTAVDAAEEAAVAADRANHLGPGILAALCRERGVGLIHISTDYVFDGLKGAPYEEGDRTNPTCVYGATKLAGEAAVMAAHADAVILRTSWVYARGGKNFVLTMLNAAARLPSLRVVSDQFGCPTNADDLALAVLTVADRMMQSRPAPGGVYHCAGSGEASWYGFAQAIFAAAADFGRPVPEVLAIETRAWPTPARRPPDTRLDCRRLDGAFGIQLPFWEPSLQRAVAMICASTEPAAGSS